MRTSYLALNFRSLKCFSFFLMDCNRSVSWYRSEGINQNCNKHISNHSSTSCYYWHHLYHNIIIEIQKRQIGNWNRFPTRSVPNGISAMPFDDCNRRKISETRKGAGIGTISSMLPLLLKLDLKLCRKYISDKTKVHFIACKSGEIGFEIRIIRIWYCNKTHGQERRWGPNWLKWDLKCNINIMSWFRLERQANLEFSSSWSKEVNSTPWLTIFPSGNGCTEQRRRVVKGGRGAG